MWTWSSSPEIELKCYQEACVTSCSQVKLLFIWFLVRLLVLQCGRGIKNLKIKLTLDWERCQAVASSPCQLEKILYLKIIGKILYANTNASPTWLCDIKIEATNTDVANKTCPNPIIMAYPVYYSFFGLLKHDFQNRARVFKTLHTISTTTHPINKTLQILCIIKHSCKNYTLPFKNHTLLPYETHVSHLLYSVCTSYTLLW